MQGPQTGEEIRSEKRGGGKRRIKEERKEKEKQIQSKNMHGYVREGLKGLKNVNICELTSFPIYFFRRILFKKYETNKISKEQEKQKDHLKGERRGIYF